MENENESEIIGVQPAEISGGAGSNVAFELSNDILKTLPLRNLSPEKAADRFQSALDAAKAFDSKDPIEAHLVAQMIGTHSAYSECLARAYSQVQSIQAIDMYLKHAAKFSSLFLEQMKTLNKHRGKGEQRVTVEHININTERTIVGNVQNNAPTIDYKTSEEFTVEMPRVKEKMLAKRSVKK